MSVKMLVKSMWWAGAGRKIIRCEVTVDGGKTWRLGNIARAGPPNAYGKHWSWVHWSLKIPLGELLPHPTRPQVNFCLPSDSCLTRAFADVLEAQPPANGSTEDMLANKHMQW